LHLRERFVIFYFRDHNQFDYHSQPNFSISSRINLCGRAEKENKKISTPPTLKIQFD